TLEQQGLILLQPDLGLTERGRNDLKRRKPQSNGFHRSPQLHIGSIAITDRLIDGPNSVPQLHASHNILGIYMQGGAEDISELFMGRHCVVVRGVEILSDGAKTEHLTSFANEAAYRFLTAFVRKCLEPESREATQSNPAKPQSESSSSGATNP